jgi:hypothetical protein
VKLSYVEETRKLVKYIADDGAAIATPAGDAQDLERWFCRGDGPSTSLSAFEAPKLPLRTGKGEIAPGGSAPKCSGSMVVIRLLS